MKVDDYKCDICKDSLREVKELIGFSVRLDGTFYPRPVEVATNHMCAYCFDNMEAFIRQTRKAQKGQMSPAEKQGWSLSW